MRHRRALLLAAAAAAGGWAAWSRWSAPSDDVGSVPSWPSLDVADLDGRAVELAATGLQIRVINLWARWCAPCRRELPSLQRMAAQLDARHFAVIALALDDDAFALREFVADQRLSLTVLRHDAARSQRVPGSDLLPRTFAVAPDGRILARWTGERRWDAPDQLNLLRALRERTMDDA